ncbi:peptidylprolyl isomerase [Candidatus Woesearchaeota archaeon]|nr:peptidylprolyl isomerase [Candidatus Woesearchaeota archaeon]
MADKVKKGDFIELDYTGKVKEEGAVFDTTLKSVADEHGLNSQKSFKPVIVCVGERHVLPGVDARLEGLSIGKHAFDIPAEEAFGKKDAKRLQLIPNKKFREQGVNPVPGLEIDVDNQVGTVRAVSGGRVIVDFNHPLASKDLSYDVDIKRFVTDQQERVKALLDVMRLPYKELTIKEGKATVTGTKELPAQFVELFAKDIVRLTKVKDITFVKGEE